MVRSIQGKLMIIYLLLILVAIELTGLYLLRSLEAYYLGSFRVGLSMHAQLLSGMVQRYLDTDGGGQPSGASGVAKLAAEFGPEGGVSVAVLDSSGLVIGASRPQMDLLGKVLQSDEISHALGGSTSESIGIDAETGVRTFFLAVPVQSAGQLLGVIYLKGSLERIYEILGNVRRIMLYATLIALGLTALIGTLLARTITGPIRELTRRATALAAGDFEQTIQVRSGDEIGRLATAFNRLTQQLKQTLGEISGEQSKLEAILAYMADGLIGLDAEGRVIRVNVAAAQMLEVEPDLILGRLLAELRPDLRLDEFFAVAQRMGQAVTAEVNSRVAAERTLLVHTTPLKGERGSIAGAVLVLHDVTQFHRLETMRREFVANVSHELKTPLTTVKSYVETLLDGAVEDPQLRARFLGVLASETDRMVRLVRDLLQLSDLDRGTAHWDIQPCDLRPVAEEALARLAVPIERKRVHILKRFEPEVPPALVDRDRVHQVFINILANAVEFTPEGGEVEVEIESAEGQLRVDVRDNGIGIPKSDLSRIFERFYRVDKARSRTLGGTGLGLAIARQIVEGLGGAISLTSEAGRGTTVTFRLPMAIELGAVSTPVHTARGVGP